MENVLALQMLEAEPIEINICVSRLSCNSKASCLSAFSLAVDITIGTGDN